MKAYHVATEEELKELDYENDVQFKVLIGPNGFECFLGAPEDCLWIRDGAPVVEELNRLHNLLTKKEKQA